MRSAAFCFRGFGKRDSTMIGLESIVASKQMCFKAFFFFLPTIVNSQYRQQELMGLFDKYSVGI